MPGLTNVVRFPIELRVVPSMDVVYDMEPDAQEVVRVAESFFLEMPGPELRRQVEAEAASYVATYILPLARHERRRLLDELLTGVVTEAVEACRKAEAVGKRSVEAQKRLYEAQIGAGSWIDSLQASASDLAQRSAELLILAYQRCQQARAVDRVIGFARRDEPWTPVMPAELTDWLIKAGEADPGRPDVRRG